MHVTRLEETEVGALHLTEGQQELVRETLSALVDSALFRRSKRYPAFLEFVVLNTLAGNAHLLKERVVADEVFGRSGDYDPSNDPVVRYTAGEVRKRMALYFGNNPEAPVRIDLPLGGYTAEFHFRPSPADEPPNNHPAEVLEAQDGLALAVDPAAPSVPSRIRVRWLIASLLVLFAFAFAIVAGSRYTGERAKRDFWWPVLHDDSPAVIVVGEGAYPSLEPGPTEKNPQPDHAAPSRDSPTPERALIDEGRIVLGNAIAVSQVCNTFRNYGRDCKVKPAYATVFPDIHNNSVLLIGAFDNALTTRFLSSLRYQFRAEPLPSQNVLVSRMIVDQSQHSSDSPWQTGRDRPSGEAGVDYAILARFHSDINDGMAVVIAGLGPQATHSAAEYVCSTKIDAMREIAARAPKSWKGVNFEAVLQIDLTLGSPGHVRVVAANYW